MSDAGEIVKSGAAEKVADLIHKLAGPMAEELGLMMADKIRVYRISNWTKTVAKTEEILKKAKLPPKAVPPRVLLPILEACSLEDDDTLQDLWAGLLASASEESDSLSPSFVETLKQLTPNQARTLSRLRDYAEAFRPFHGYKLDLAEGLSVTDNEGGRLATEAFERLGLIRRQYDLEPPDGVSLPQSVSYIVVNQPMLANPIDNWSLQSQKGNEELPKLSYRLQFTEYGMRFMEACRGPQETEEASGSQH